MRAIDFVPAASPASICHVRCRRALLDRSGDELRAVGPWDSIHVLHDTKLPAIAARVIESLRAALGATPVHALDHPGGESHKSLAAVGELATRLLAQGASRRSLLIVIGGGCLTDLGGFCASVFMRGIELVLVPTTVLAMADAAIGGKNGVDLGGAKNMLGTIRQPRAVLVDPLVLADLPDPLVRDGLVEVVKVAAISDVAAFDWLETNFHAVLARDPAALDEAIWTAIRQKLAVVQADERESGARALLNFGHTIAHALESLTAFRMSHGNAVAIGMPIEMRMLGADPAATSRVIALLDQLGMPRKIPSEFADVDVLWGAMQTDKKRAAGALRIAAATRIGVGAIAEIGRAQLRSALAR